MGDEAVKKATRYSAEESAPSAEGSGYAAEEARHDPEEDRLTPQSMRAADRKERAEEPKWAIGKLVLGILSYVLFVLVMFQSCVAGVGNSLSDNGEIGGSAGALCALNLLISGLIAVIARRSVKKAPMIVAAVLLWLNLFYAKMMAGSYSDLVIWGYLSFVFGLVYLFSVMRTRKEQLITGAVAAVYLIAAVI